VRRLAGGGDGVPGPPRDAHRPAMTRTGLVRVRRAHARVTAWSADRYLPLSEQRITGLWRFPSTARARARHVGFCLSIS
jgi:hypothetical protein